MAQRVGIDLTSVAAVQEAVATHGDAYLSRVYTDHELADCAGDPARLAGRFAAKEATLKVLRPGPATSVPWRSIEVLRHSDGYVDLVLVGAAAARAADEGLHEFAVSLTHEAGSACAVVVAAAPSGLAGPSGTQG